METVLSIVAILPVLGLGLIVGGFLKRSIQRRTKSTVPRLLVELLSGVLAVLCYLAFFPPLAFLLEGNPGWAFEGSALEYGLSASWLPFEMPLSVAAGLSAVLVYTLLCLLLIVTCIDILTMEIPNALTLGVAALGVVSVFVGPTSALPWVDHLIGAACVSVPLLALAFVFAGSFGLGDVKLMAAAGLFLGWQLVLSAAFIGVLLGGIYGIYALLTKRLGRKEHFAFGPALCIGIATSIFAAEPIRAWFAVLFA